MSGVSRRLALAGLALLGAGGLLWQGRKKRHSDAIAALYADPLPAPTGPFEVFHLGHSLVGRDMPAMLAQLAGHDYASQLGWGTSLHEHWDPALPINGFEVENDHPNYRDAREAIGSGDYGAVVLTEMVEIADAIRYHDSAETLAHWVALAREANPQTRIYLYETWHHTDDRTGWLLRIDRDLHKFWLDGVAYPAMAQTQVPIYLIPAGQVMAAVVRAIEAEGDIGGLTSRDDLFSKNEDDTIDTIHFNDIGAYLVALTHYAVLYHRAPEGLAHQLKRADGTMADAPTEQAAERLQQIVWDVVRRLPQTGVAT